MLKKFKYGRFGEFWKKVDNTLCMYYNHNKYGWKNLWDFLDRILFD